MTSSRRLAEGALWLALVGLALAVSLQSIRSFDYWWHLRTGQLIAETGAVPKADVYTFSVPGARWIDVHWLFQVGLYAIHGLGGHVGVVMAKAAVALGLLALLVPIGFRRDRAALSALAFTPMLLLLSDRLMPRPELPSFLLLAGVLALLERFRRRCREGGPGPDRWIWAIPVLQLVWVNLHGLFPLGLALCGFYWIDALVSARRAPPGPERFAPALQLLPVGVVAGLVSFVNPNGLDAVLYPLQQLRMIGPPEQRDVLGAVILELAPALSEGGLRPGARALFLGLAGASFGVALLNLRRAAASDTLVLAAFLFLALGAKRNVPLFAIVATPLLVRNLNDFLDAHIRAGRVAWAASAAAAVAIALLAGAIASGRGVGSVASAREAGFGVLEVLHPVGAAEWITRERPPGPIFHSMYDGGYLTWRLYPDYPVMVDGRLEVFGPRRFLELSTQTIDGFRSLDREFRFGSVLLNLAHGRPDILYWFHLNSNWQLAYLDDTFALYVRVGVPGLEELDLDAPDLLPPIGPGTGESQRMRLRSRATFFLGVRRYARAVEAWEELIRRFPDEPDAAVTRARLLQWAGELDRADAVLMEALAAAPHDAVLISQLGHLRGEQERTEEARALFARALELSPDHPGALIGLAVLAEREGDPQGASLYYRRVLGQPDAGPYAARAAERLRALSSQGAIY